MPQNQPASPPSIHFNPFTAVGINKLRHPKEFITSKKIKMDKPYLKCTFQIFFLFFFFYILTILSIKKEGTSDERIPENCPNGGKICLNCPWQWKVKTQNSFLSIYITTKTFRRCSKPVTEATYQIGVYRTSVYKKNSSKKHLDGKSLFHNAVHDN